MATDREIALEQALVTVFDVASRGAFQAEDLLKEATALLWSGKHRLNDPDIKLINAELSSAFVKGFMG